MTAASLERRSINDGFGRLIDLFGAEPVAMAKHGWPVVVLAVEEYERLKAVQAGAARQRPRQHAG
jgi:hypothetical protein